MWQSRSTVDDDRRQLITLGVLQLCVQREVGTVARVPSAYIVERQQRFRDREREREREQPDGRVKILISGRAACTKPAADHSLDQHRVVVYNTTTTTTTTVDNQSINQSIVVYYRHDKMQANNIK